MKNYQINDRLEIYANFSIGPVLMTAVLHNIFIHKEVFLKTEF